MKKLTAEKCREQIAECQALKERGYLSISGEYKLQALEIALPVLEQQERGGHEPNHAQCCAIAGGDISICDCVNKDWVYLAPKSTAIKPQGEWIEWRGGEGSPVDKDSLVKVKWRNGAILEDAAYAFAWYHDGDHDDIIAYRVIENDGREG